MNIDFFLVSGGNFCLIQGLVKTPKKFFILLILKSFSLSETSNLVGFDTLVWYNIAKTRPEMAKSESRTS